MQETTIYLSNKKMKPFFSKDDLTSFIKDNYKEEFVQIYQIRNEMIDSAYRIEADLFIGLALNSHQELFYISQDGEAFFSNDEPDKQAELIQKYFK